MLLRKEEIHLLKLLRQFPVVGILGPRQVGKTTLAMEIIPRMKKKTIYLDLESLEDRSTLRAPELFLRQHTDKCVILDEIQFMPELFPLLRSLVDRDRKPARFLVLGSANPSIIKGASESLAGRIAYLELNPFSIADVPANIAMEKHWFRGGFPDSLLAKRDGDAQRWLDAFIKTYIERDLPLLGIGTSPQIIQRFWTMLATAHGNTWNASAFGRSLGMSDHSVNHYLDYHEGAFLVQRLKPFFVNARKRMVKSPKVYLRDSGILHRLLRIADRNALQHHIALGASWEGYVIEQIRRTISDQLDLYYYRTHGGAELDLVITKADKPLYGIEIKYSSAPVLSKGSFESIDDLKLKKTFVIVPSGTEYPLRKDIIVCGLQHWMKKYLPLVNRA